MPRPLLLLSNDDGYRAIGLGALRDHLLKFADVVVCAPESEQSASSHSLSIHRALRLRRHEQPVPGTGTPSGLSYSIDGTPADCVYVALNGGERILPRRPDLVVSGINHGVNLGDDVFYSGTVAAGREAALKGVPGLALSRDPSADLEACAAFGARLVRACLLLLGLAATPTELRQRRLLFNVNFPPGDHWPLTVTRLGLRQYEDLVDFRHDPRGKEYLWIGGPTVQHLPLEGSDTAAFDAGQVGITPLALDAWSGADADLAGRLAALVIAE